jgi:hypothetical protein
LSISNTSSKYDQFPASSVSHLQHTGNISILTSSTTQITAQREIQMHEVEQRYTKST